MTKDTNEDELKWKNTVSQAISDIYLPRSLQLLLTVNTHQLNYSLATTK
jgi:hypothetical protein